MNQNGFWRGVWNLDMEFMNGLMEGFTQASGKRTKCMKKALYIDPMVESIRERRKTWKQHGFFITAMRNSKSRFMHGSNVLHNKANEKSSRWLLSCPNNWKKCLSNCMRRWIESRHRRISFQVKFWEGTFNLYLLFI